MLGRLMLMQTRTIKRSFIVVFMVFQLIISGCSKDINVTDYGTSDGETLNSDNYVFDTQNMSDKTVKEQIGVETIEWNESKEVNSKTVELSVNYTIPEIDWLGAYNVKQLDYDESREKTLVSNLFGNTSTKIEDVVGELSDAPSRFDMVSMYKSIESEHVEYIDEMQGDDISSDQGNNEHPVSYVDLLNNISTLPGQVDLKDEVDRTKCFLHGYKGVINGVTYILIYGYSFQLEKEYIWLKPANPGEYIGNETVTSDFLFADYDRIGDSSGVYVNTQDVENECTQSESSIKKDAGKFLSSKMMLDIDSSLLSMDRGCSLLPGRWGYSDTANYNTDVYFLDETSATNNEIDKGIKDGFVVYMNCKPSGIKTFSTYSLDTQRYKFCNSGEMIITSKGFYALNLENEL